MPGGTLLTVHWCMYTAFVWMDGWMEGWMAR